MDRPTRTGPVSNDHDSSEPREQLVTQQVQEPGLDDGAAERHLRSIPLERIEQLTTALSSPVIRADAGEQVRVLLGLYTEAVAHLRAVAGSVIAQVDGAVLPIKQARRSLLNELKFQNGAHGRLRKRRAAIDAAAHPRRQESH